MREKFIEKWKCIGLDKHVINSLFPSINSYGSSNSSSVEFCRVNGRETSAKLKLENSLDDPIEKTQNTHSFVLLLLLDLRRNR